MSGQPGSRRNRNYAAGERLTQLREDLGLSRRDLERKLQLDWPGDARYHVSERTIRRIEDEGCIPTVRVKFALAQAFGLVPSHVWGATPLPAPVPANSPSPLAAFA